MPHKLRAVLIPVAAVLVTAGLIAVLYFTVLQPMASNAVTDNPAPTSPTQTQDHKTPDVEDLSGDIPQRPWGPTSEESDPTHVEDLDDPGKLTIEDLK